MTTHLFSYRFLDKLAYEPALEAIWLFGSRARGDARARSDIDLALVCPTATPQEWQKMEEIIEDADTLLQIDCVRFDALPQSSFKNNILHDHIVLFQKGGHPMTFIRYETVRDLGEAITRLEEVLQAAFQGETDYAQDASIQRFEFCMELYWKVLQSILRYEGIEATSPREVLVQAFVVGLIHDETTWTAMLRDRNRTSHIYRREVADEVFGRLAGYARVMRETYIQLQQRLNRD